MTKKKHSLLAIVSCLLLLAMAIGFTSLYLTDNDTATNTVTVGDVKIDLLEPNWEDTNNVVPNQELPKDPQIKNVGINDAVVFMTVEVPVENITLTADDGTKGVKGNNELFWFKDSADGASVHANNFDTNWVHLDTRDTGANLAGTTRTYVFAYKTPISKDETTTALFDKIQVKNFIENEIPAGKTEQIKINAYGIQASDVLESGVDLTDTLSNANLDKIYSIFIKQAFNQDAPTGPEHQDLTYNVENAAVQAYMAQPAYDSNDYTYTYITLPTEKEDYPNSGTLTVPEGAATITVTSTSDGKNFTDTLSGTSYEVKNLIPNISYTYVMKDSSNNVVKDGTITPTGTKRLIKAQKGRNTRDFGGLTADNGTLKYGVLYRGAELDGKSYGDSFILTEADKAFYANFLGIKAELDLRDAKESSQVAALNGVDYLCTNNLGAYGNFRQDTRVATAINFIADELSQNKPTYIHCMAGADRTGTIACLVEAICGVPEDQIDRDYELTTLARMNGNSAYTRNSSLWTELKNAINMLNFSTFRDNAVASLINLGVSLETINSIRHSLIDGNPTDITMEYLMNGGTNVFDKTTAQVGTRVNSSGNVVAAESWSVTTASISCQKGDVFYVVSDRVINIPNRYAGAVYDSGNTMLRKFSFIENTKTAFVSITDDTATSIRFTIPCDNIDNIAIYKIN